MLRGIPSALPNSSGAISSTSSKMMVVCGAFDLRRSTPRHTGHRSSVRHRTYLLSWCQEGPPLKRKFLLWVAFTLMRLSAKTGRNLCPAWVPRWMTSARWYTPSWLEVLGMKPKRWWERPPYV
jgi:hypothetical protein